MQAFITAVPVLLAVLLLWAILTRNRFVRIQNQIAEAWADIDICLKQKANILQNLVDTIRIQTGYEGELLVKITQARSGIEVGTDAGRIRTNDSVDRLLPPIYAVMERYPKLGANDSFANLREETAACEGKIRFARRRYNLTVIAFNIAQRSFPSCIIAGLMHLTPGNVYELAEKERDQSDNLRIRDIQ